MARGRLQGLGRGQGRLWIVGPEDVLGVKQEHAQEWDDGAVIPGLSSARRIVDSRGIAIADLVLVPLEDGDRTEALRKTGKKVIAIDLNPLSRTSQWASITIVDNVKRCLPLMCDSVPELQKKTREELESLVASFDNAACLSDAISAIRARIEGLARDRELELSST